LRARRIGHGHERVHQIASLAFGRRPIHDGEHVDVARGPHSAYEPPIRANRRRPTPRPDGLRYPADDLRRLTVRIAMLVQPAATEIVCQPRAPSGGGGVGPASCSAPVPSVARTDI
jgi:hypothetical protein